MCSSKKVFTGVEELLPSFDIPLRHKSGWMWQTNEYGMMQLMRLCMGASSALWSITLHQRWLNAIHKIYSTLAGCTAILKDAARRIHFLVVTGSGSGTDTGDVIVRRRKKFLWLMLRSMHSIYVSV